MRRDSRTSKTGSFELKLLTFLKEEHNLVFELISEVVNSLFLPIEDLIQITYSKMCDKVDPLCTMSLGPLVFNL